MTDWQLQDAKNRFSAVVDAALSGFPQRVTRRGKPIVVVLSVDEYERLCQLERAQGNCSRLRGRVGLQSKFRAWLSLCERPDGP